MRLFTTSHIRLWLIGGAVTAVSSADANAAPSADSKANAVAKADTNAHANPPGQHDQVPLTQEETARFLAACPDYKHYAANLQ